jgi:K+-sensing histidine kinase KdpD
VNVSIKDSGKGIDPIIKENLFEKFATRSGMGLGLYLSKKIIEAHGGNLWAENNVGSKGKKSACSPTYTYPRNKAQKANLDLDWIKAYEPKLYLFTLQ